MGRESAEPADRLPGGLLVSERGYTLEPVDAPAGGFAFRIAGPDGRPVTRYDVAHDRKMHLIVARRDLSGFRHVHPDLAADGTWRVDTPLAGPGQWRAFADFTPTDGEPLTLGVDVTVPGELVERPLPAPATTTTVDGYTVTLAGAPQPGRTSPLTLTVSRGGQPVTDLEPYLGAYGHLVALRRVTSRTCTCTRTAHPATVGPHPARPSPSWPTCPPPAATGSTSTSDTLDGCTPPSSPSSPAPPRPEASPPRPGRRHPDPGRSHPERPRHPGHGHN
ncbi:hypothetical protein NKG94_32190 [Micromonospora sp. M12]